MESEQHVKKSGEWVQPNDPRNISPYSFHGIPEEILKKGWDDCFNIRRCTGDDPHCLLKKRNKTG